MAELEKRLYVKVLKMEQLPYLQTVCTNCFEIYSYGKGQMPKYWVCHEPCWCGLNLEDAGQFIHDTSYPYLPLKGCAAMSGEKCTVRQQLFKFQTLMSIYSYFQGLPKALSMGSTYVFLLSTMVRAEQKKTSGH